MKVYKVSPILKYSPFFSLTYISKDDYKIGTIVPINFNNREIEAVVKEVISLKDARVEIRKADFQTKKIASNLKTTKINILDKKLFDVLNNFSNNFGIPIGELLWFLSDELETNKSKLSTLVYYPDDLSLKIAKEENAFRGKDIFKYILADACETLIIKDFNFDKYLDFQAPHISKLDLLFAIIKNIPTSIKKIVLETDFLGVVEQNYLQENTKEGKLFGKIELDLKVEKKIGKKFLVKVGRDKNGEEEIVVNEVLEIIRNKKSELEKKFFFVLSHGYADRIFCNDCKKSYGCEQCEHSYSILNQEGSRFLYCKNCKHKKVLAEDQYLICKHCGSWRIFPFGIGGQKVKEYLEKETNIKNILIDESEKKISVKKINESVNRFLSAEGENILIGSIRTLKVLKEKKSVDKTFVISTGPLVRGQSFDSDEKLMRLISEIENISKEVYINKRDGDEVSLESYKDKEKFIKDEIVFRKKAGLPPEKKILSLISNYRNKKVVDKLKPDGEIKKGSRVVFYWFINKENEAKEKAETLRQLGDVIVANSIVENSVQSKKK